MAEDAKEVQPLKLDRILVLWLDEGLHQHLHFICSE
jgi:hypothetical protein